jgi:hypothetical protein
LFLRDNQIGGYNAQTLPITYEQVSGKTAITIPVIEYLPVAITDAQKLNMISYILDGAYREELAPRIE